VSDDARAAEAFGALRERIDRGEHVDIDEAIRAHPGLEEPLRRQFAAMRLAEGLLRAPAGLADAAALVGRSLGPWRLTAVLGRGGMGTVFAATKGAAKAAVKVLHPHLVAREGFVERFLREADAGRRVRHANVVATIEAGTTQAGAASIHYLVMEHVEGRTLRALLAEEGRLPEALCRHVGREAALALAAIHAEGFVHRDVKPENLIVTPDHVVKVMDLGVARLLHDAEGLSQTGAFVGSVRYAAPEQFGGPAPRSATSEARSAKGGDAVDGRADLYALGLTLYEAATGAHPFPDEDFHVVLKRQLTDVPRRAGELNPQLSAFLEELLAQLLAKDRERRPASAALVADVLDGGEDSAWWRDRSRALRDETQRPLRRMRVPRETALYGRETELARLRSLFERASAGDGQVAVVEGEAGIGKSRLVEEFVGRVLKAGHDVNFLYGSYPPGGAATATGAFTAAYRDHVGDDDSAVRDVLPQTPLLAPAFAALLRGDLPPAGAEVLTKDSLHTVFIHATRNLAARRATIVLIDDLHFAPEEGRALFAALALAVPGHRVLLIGGARPALDPNWLAQLDRLSHATRVPVSRLGAKDLVLLLRDTLKSEHLAEELSARIAVKSDGNPFFVFEILRGLREGQFITKRSDGTWATTREIREIVVPSSVVDLVQARVSDLSRADRNVLEAASCIGFEFDPALVGEVLRMERIPLLQTLGAVEKSHRLVRSLGRRFVFDHHQVMEVLYAGLSEPLREEYHAAIGTALEARSGAATKQPADVGGALCADLAEHLLKGGQGPRALRYIDAAMEYLEGRYANEALLGLIDRALEAPGLFAGGARAALLVRKAARLNRVGRHEPVRAAIDEAIALADAAGDGALGARARYELGHHLIRLSRPAEAQPHLQDASDLARRAGERRLEGWAERDLGFAKARMSFTVDSLVHHERHLAISREIGDRRGEALAYGNIGIVFFFTGRAAEGRDYFRRHLEIALEIGHRECEMMARHSLAVAELRDCRYEEAVRRLEHYRELARAIGERQSEAVAVGNLANCASGLGRLAEALELGERYRALGRETGSRLMEAIAQVNLGALHRGFGRLAEARARCEESLSIAREVGARHPEGYAIQVLAHLDDDEGNVAGAERGFADALALRRELGHLDGVADSLAGRGVLFTRQGRVDEAVRDLDEALAIARQVGLGGTEAAVAAHRALLPGGDAAAAVAALASHESRTSAALVIETRFVLWKATGDRAHLAEAARRLGYAVAHAPARHRETMLAIPTLHREVAAAASAAGLPVGSVDA
jgi:serine/threonine protein kinase/tetratricopeptide (TPR) repeat protein